MEGIGDKYFLDAENYYVTKEIFREIIEPEGCQICGNHLFWIYAEKYLYFEEVDAFMLMGCKVYGYECESCRCCFIHQELKSAERRK